MSFRNDYFKDCKKINSSIFRRQFLSMEDAIFIRRKVLEKEKEQRIMNEFDMQDEMAIYLDNLACEAISKK